MITITAFRWVPPVAQGLVRDFRVRWALEEAGVPYEVKLIGFEDQATPEYRALQPFGQVPAFVEDGLTLFESGAIVLRIAERSPALMPDGADDRARVTTWVFAALNSIEPFVQMYFGDRQNAKLEAMIVKRLTDLGAALEGRAYLVADRFTAADLMMCAVLRILRDTDLVARAPSLAAYLERGTARPAFHKAIADQLAVFAAHAPPANKT
jgi:glutathione S-transferase